MSDKEVGRDKMLDEILDGALAEYSQAEPRPGLDNRILAGLASDQERSWRWNWKWVVGFATACVVLAMILVPREQRRTPEISKMSSDAGAKTSAGAEAQNKLSAGRGAKAPLSHHNPLEGNAHSRQVAVNQQIARQNSTSGNQQAVVKQPVFPAPSPLSEQERLLFAYLRRTPYQELVQNSKPDEPKVESEINQVTPEQEKSLNTDSNSR